MIKSTYKPGEDIFSSNTNNYYTQLYWFDGIAEFKLKGYRNKYDSRIGYGEDYIEWKNKGIKYIL